MTPGLRIVAPFRPCPPESELHRQLAADGFDWLEALRMCTHSARLACGCPVHALTDLETTLPVETLHVPTTERRLMLWTLDACAAFLASQAFDRDTVMLDVDQLVYGNLARYFTPGVNLGVLVRTTAKHAEGQPLLNGVQFWHRRNRSPLVRFYREALALARTLPEDRLVWGADTDAVRQLLEPITLGIHERAGLVVEMIDAEQVLETYNNRLEWTVSQGLPVVPIRPVVDFRWFRKPAMAALYRASIGAEVAC